MKSTKEHKEEVYKKQSEIFSDSSEEYQKLTETWFDESTADYWMHNRMYEAVDCIKDLNSSWLTVGDGRWGLDAIRIKKRGFQKVLPTDICETLLKASKERGLINEYQIENAENLSLKDNSTDYVFCKESYHHFPRPHIALYEILRVANKAVFLSEPNDDPLVSTVSFKKYLIYKLKAFLAKKGFGKAPKFYGKNVFPNYQYEDSGNYIFSISIREVQKIAQGINLPQIAYKGYNSHYIKGCEFEPADTNKSQIFKDMVNTINNQNKKCELGTLSYSGIMLGIFKEEMDKETRVEFENRGWTVIDLPYNPYID